MIKIKIKKEDFKSLKDQKDFTDNIKAILARVELYENVVILGHTHPDGDAIGSAQALGHWIAKKVPPKNFLHALSSS